MSSYAWFEAGTASSEDCQECQEKAEDYLAEIRRLKSELDRERRACNTEEEIANGEYRLREVWRRRARKWKRRAREWRGGGGQACAERDEARAALLNAENLLALKRESVEVLGKQLATTRARARGMRDALIWASHELRAAHRHGAGDNAHWAAGEPIP